MFNESIRKTPFTTADADILFGNITMPDSTPEQSLLATCRALLHPRMREGEQLTITCKTSSTFQNAADLALRYVFAGSPGSQLLWINVSGMCEEGNADEYFKDREGWWKFQKCTDFFRNTVGVHVYINDRTEGRETSVVMVQTSSLSVLHYVQCGILNFVPWIFNRKKEFLPHEMELIEGLRSKKPDLYMKTLTEMIETYDIRKFRIERLLKDYEEARDKVLVQNKEAEIARLEAMMERAMQEYIGYSQDKRDLRNELVGLYAAIDNNEHHGEIMEYFNANKSLWLVSADGGSGKIRFTVRTYLEYFDPDVAEACISNRNSYMYSNPGMKSRVRPEDMELLLRALFVDCTMKIRMCATYDLGRNMSAVGGFHYGTDCDTYLPNPHIHYYSCLGHDYPRTAAECLAKGDLIGAIEQCVASAKSVNFEERPTAGALIEHLYGMREMPEGMSERYIELNDGRIVTPKEAIAYLKKGKESK